MVAYGANRMQAHRRLRSTLVDSAVLGLHTTRDYVTRALSLPAFALQRLAMCWPCRVGRLGAAEPAQSLLRTAGTLEFQRPA